MLNRYSTTALGIASLVVIGLSFFMYSRSWESKQEKITLNNPVVTSINRYRGGDVHWNLNGVRVLIEGEEKPIDFPSRNWDYEIAEGDTLDSLVVRDSFPWFGLFEELDGLSATR